MASASMEAAIGALGEPADAASASRTIHITAGDQLKFAPSSVDIKAGETVTFEIENTGSVDHEFAIGSASYQQAHEQEMMASPMAMGEEPNAVEVPAGQTASLTWHFTETGTTDYACHKPGHFAAGMLGTITVS